MVQFSNRTNLSPVRKRWYNTQTLPKPFTSQKKVVQYSNRAKICHQSEKDGTILKQGQNLSNVRKDGTILKQSQNLIKSEKDSTILKQSKTCQSQKKMVQYSNRAKTCQLSEKDGTILKQCQNLLTVRKKWYNTQIEQKAVTSQKKM